MHARVVRFTDVTPERVEEIVAEVEESREPPSGADPSRLQMLYDREQGTAVVVAFFESEEKLREADSAFEEMDPGETPGTRASVDRAELKLDRPLG